MFRLSIYYRKVLWEEKNLTEMKTSCENKNESVINGITNDTNKTSSKKGCKDTGKVWKRNCPKCGVEMFYSKQPNYCRSKRTNAKCIWCRHDGQLIGRIQSEEEKEKRAKKLRGKKRSLESRKKYSESKIGKNNPWFGKHTPKSEEHRRKIRLSCIEVVKNRLESVGKTIRPSFNIDACKTIDEYGKLHGYNFQHAMNGGEYHIKELGYWLDGYDKNKNTVVEFFENNHWHRKNKNKDLNRRKEIIDFLRCEFIILREQIGGSYLPEHFLR